MAHKVDSRVAFAPLFKWCLERDYTPSLDEPELLCFDVSQNSWVNVNLPGYFVPGDSQWGVSIIFVRETKDDSRTFDTLEDLIEWLEQRIKDYHQGAAICGTCGNIFPDIYPAARCPYEYNHQEV